MSNRAFLAVLLVILVMFVPVVSVQAFDIAADFSMPDAPDAGQIVGFTVYHGTYIVPLNNGTVKVYRSGDEAGWSSAPLAAFLEDGEGLQGLSILEQGCEARGLGELSAVSIHGSGFPGAEERVYGPGPGAHLFWKRDVTPLERGFLAGPVLSEGCFLAQMTRTHGADMLSWESPGAQGSFALRGGAGGLLDGIVPANETIRGLELTSEDGPPLLLAATERAVYAVSFTGDGTTVQTQQLNRIPRFTGIMSASCMAGEGPATLAVTATDDDGDPLTITQAGDQPGFDGTTITLDCSETGVHAWTFTASDGKTDDIDLPTATYRITAGHNHPPVWSDFTVHGANGVTGVLPPARDPDGDQLTYCLYTCNRNDPVFMLPYVPPVSIHGDGSYRPQHSGTFTYPVAVSDGESETVVKGTFVIGSGPHAPVWSDFTVQGTEGVVTGHLPPATDPDGDPLTYCLYTCDPNAPPPPPVATFVSIWPDGSFRPERAGTFTYPVAVSDGERETVVMGTFVIGELVCPPGIGPPFLPVSPPDWFPYVTTVSAGSCNGAAPCNDFGNSTIYKFCVDSGTDQVRFSTGTKDFTYDVDMIVMHGAVPPASVHPYHPDSPFFPDILSLYDLSSEHWNLDAVWEGHRYYYRIQRGGVSGGSTESITINYPPPGWYYVKFFNVSNNPAKVQLGVITR